jgi:hypothetical protein
MVEAAVRATALVTVTAPPLVPAAVGPQAAMVAGMPAQMLVAAVMAAGMAPPVEVPERLRPQAPAPGQEPEAPAQVQLQVRPWDLLTDQILTAPIWGAVDVTLPPTFREGARLFSTIHPDRKTCRSV